MRNLVLLTFLLLSVTVSAQRANQKYRFTTEVSQYIFGNIPVSVEKIFGKRGTIGLTAAVRFATNNSGEYDYQGPFSTGNGNIYDYTGHTTFNRFYNAYTLGIHFKYYFRDHRTFYLEPNIYYRYWYFNEKEVAFRSMPGFEGGYRFDGIRSENQRDFVFGINFGRSIKLKQTRKNKYLLDFEVGVGLIDRSYEFTTITGTVRGEEVEPNYREKGFGKYPMINLGLSFGFER